MEKCGMWCGVAEQSNVFDSSSGVSDQQSVGSSSGRDTCILQTQALVFLTSRVWVPVPVVTLVYFKLKLWCFLTECGF